jgi:hypothetical protein
MQLPQRSSALALRCCADFLLTPSKASDLRFEKCPQWCGGGIGARGMAISQYRISTGLPARSPCAHRISPRTNPISAPLQLYESVNHSKQSTRITRVGSLVRIQYRPSEETARGCTDSLTLVQPRCVSGVACSHAEPVPPTADASCNRFCTLGATDFAPSGTQPVAHGSEPVAERK